MAGDELKALVARNAQAIERLEQQSERTQQQLERTQQQLERTQQQLELLTRQVQSKNEIQYSNTGRIASAERNIQGIFDVLLTNAREQAERSKLIDQQIQSLIDERRRA